MANITVSSRLTNARLKQIAASYHELASEFFLLQKRFGEEKNNAQKILDRHRAKKILKDIISQPE